MLLYYRREYDFTSILFFKSQQYLGALEEKSSK